jgi:hypothetical protein
MTIKQKIAELTESVNNTDDAITEAEYTALSDEEKANYEAISEADKADEDVMKDISGSIDVTEDVKALTDGEELSEEFKTKAATIFEAAVVSRVKSAISTLTEQYDTKLEEGIEEIKEGLIEKIDGYLDYIVEQWMTENELALENGLKTEIQESFITDLKKVFEDHYIDLPEEKFDVLGELNNELSETNNKLDEEFKNNVELKKEIIKLQRDIAINETSNGLVSTDAEKFRKLTEDLVYENKETFVGKLQTIKETYFGKKDQPKNIPSVVSDSPILTEEVTNVTGAMAAYLKTLNNMTNK